MAKRRSGKKKQNRKRNRSSLIPIRKQIQRVRNGQVEVYQQTYYINPFKYKGLEKKYDDAVKPIKKELEELKNISQEFFKEIDKDNPDWNKVKSIFNDYIRVKIEAGSKLVSQSTKESIQLRTQEIPKLIDLLEKGEASGINMVRTRSGLEQDRIYNQYDILFTGAYINTPIDIVTGSQFGRPNMKLFSKALERLARENPELYSKIETVDVIPRISSFRYEFSWMEGIADSVKSKLQEIMGTNGFPHFDLELMMGFKFKKNANLTKDDIQKMMDFISRNMQRSEEIERVQPFKVRKSDFKNIRNKDLRSLGYIKVKKRGIYVKPENVLWSVPDVRINLNRLK